MSIIAVLEARRKTRSSIFRSLIGYAFEINDSLVQHGVRGPYAHHFEVPDERLASFQAKETVLLHHVNLLRDLYEHRDLVGAGTVKTYENWMKTILYPWIMADEDLRSIWNYFLEVRDGVDEKFISWANKQVCINEYGQQPNLPVQPTARADRARGGGSLPLRDEPEQG